MYIHHSSQTLLSAQLKGIGYACLIGATVLEGPYAIVALSSLTLSLALDFLHKRSGQQAEVSNPKKVKALLQALGPNHSGTQQQNKEIQQLRYNIARDSAAATPFSDIKKMQALLFFAGTAFTVLTYQGAFCLGDSQKNAAATILSYTSTTLNSIGIDLLPFITVAAHIATLHQADLHVNHDDNGITYSGTNRIPAPSSRRAITGDGVKSFEIGCGAVLIAAAITSGVTLTLAAQNINATTNTIIGSTAIATYLTTSVFLHRDLVANDRDHASLLPVRFSDYQSQLTGITLAIACFAAQRTFYATVDLPFWPDGSTATSTATTGSFILTAISIALPALATSHFPNAPSSSFRGLFGDYETSPSQASAPGHDRDDEAQQRLVGRGPARGV
jgi:hypothetical protein